MYRNTAMALSALIAVYLGGCAGSGGNVSNVRGAALAIDYGDPKSKVLDVFGTPGDRSFSGTDEAWQYCSTGWSKDTYLTVWFSEATVIGITSKDATLANGSCDLAYQTVDWGQRPADKKIDININ